jgi:hypothetical protein
MANPPGPGALLQPSDASARPTGRTDQARSDRTDQAHTDQARSDQGRRASSQPDSGDASSARAAEQVQQKAGEVWSDVREGARFTVEQQQQGAAAGLADFADALRVAARELENKQKPTVARFAAHAADSLEKASGSLRNKELGTVVRDVESFAREQPAVFFGAALAAGFLAIRFLKSSDSTGQADRRRHTVGLPTGVTTDRRHLH